MILHYWEFTGLEVRTERRADAQTPQKASVGLRKIGLGDGKTWASLSLSNEPKHRERAASRPQGPGTKLGTRCGMVSTKELSQPDRVPVVLLLASGRDTGSHCKNWIAATYQRTAPRFYYIHHPLLPSIHRHNAICGMELLLNHRLQLQQVLALRHCGRSPRAKGKVP